MTLLENLDKNMATLGPAREDSATVQRLIGEYNRYLSMLLESREDGVLSRMFPLLAPIGETDTAHDRFVEVKLAVTGLVSYLQKIEDRH